MTRALLLAVLACLLGAGCRKVDQPPLEGDVWELRGDTMGTTWLVRVEGPPPEAEEETLRRDLEQLLASFNQKLSTWIDDSEISAFNRSEPDAETWQPVSPELATVVDAALRWSRDTGGAFDITVGPVTKLWGFGKDTTPTAPTDEALDAARTQVGHANLHVRLDPPALRKTIPTLTLDVAAIAKGYAVDLLAARAAEVGALGYLVEIGGELRASGAKRGGAAWMIGIEKPVEGVRVIQRRAPLVDCALASSGNYRNVRRAGDQRWSHTLDPRTGRPVTHDLAGVSIAHERCMDADALCTAYMVLGPDEGFDHAERHDIAALFLTRDDEGQITSRATPAFLERFGPADG